MSVTKNIANNACIIERVDRCCGVDDNNLGAMQTVQQIMSNCEQRFDPTSISVAMRRR